MAQKKNAKAIVVFNATNDGKMLGLMIDNLHSRNSAVMADAHIAAVSCVLHLVYARRGDNPEAYQNNDEPANQLCEVFADDNRINSLRRWFEQIGPFVWNKEKKRLALSKAKLAEFREVAEEEQTKALVGGITFWKLDPPKPYKGFDPEALVFSIINRGEAVLEDDEKANDPKTKINPEFWRWIKKAMNDKPWTKVSALPAAA